MQHVLFVTNKSEFNVLIYYLSEFIGSISLVFEIGNSILSILSRPFYAEHRSRACFIDIIDNISSWFEIDVSVFIYII